MSIFFASCAENGQIPAREGQRKGVSPDRRNGHLTVSLVKGSSKRPAYSVSSADYSWTIPVVINPYKYAGEPNNPLKLDIDYNQIVSKTHAIIALNESAGGEDEVSCLLLTHKNEARLFQIKFGYQRAKKDPGTPRFWYTWKVSDFSSDGVFMDDNRAFYRWSDLVVKQIGSYSGSRIAEQTVPSDGHKPSSHVAPAGPAAPADAH
jgi:hypothetical protein